MVRHAFVSCSSLTLWALGWVASSCAQSLAVRDGGPSEGGGSAGGSSGTSGGRFGGGSPNIDGGNGGGSVQSLDAGDLWPAPNAFLPLGGPGIAARTFAPEQLTKTCAHLTGGPNDRDHHNVIHSFDGYFLLPWAPESGGGGLTVFNLSNPCSPTKVAEVETPHARETHALAFSFIGNRWWGATNSKISGNTGGILIWDLSNPRQPTIASSVNIPGFQNPDGYQRVVEAMAWVGTWLYLASGDLGVDVIDVADPRNPRYVRRHSFAPTLRTFSIKAVGTLLFVHGVESPRAELLDISDPANPQPIPGGAFSIRESPVGLSREAYGANLQGGYAYFARKDSGGGVIIYDVHEPSAPRFAGISMTGFGNGAYVYVKDDHLAFVGESGGASLYDITNLGAIRRLMSFSLQGDLDTIMPLGNVVILSVDDGAVPRQSTAVVPWAEKPDREGPHVSWAWPKNNAVVPVTASFGVTFSEFVEPRSVFAGSVRLFETRTGKRVDGVLSVQESIASISPLLPLQPDTEYTLWIPRGGVLDWSQNPTENDFTVTVRTEP